jgi:hypothetical protein
MTCTASTLRRAAGTAAPTPAPPAPCPPARVRAAPRPLPPPPHIHTYTLRPALLGEWDCAARAESWQGRVRNAHSLTSRPLRQHSPVRAPPGGRRSRSSGAPNTPPPPPPRRHRLDGPQRAGRRCARLRQRLRPRQPPRRLWWAAPPAAPLSWTRQLLLPPPFWPPGRSHGSLAAAGAGPQEAITARAALCCTAPEPAARRRRWRGRPLRHWARGRWAVLWGGVLLQRRRRGRCCRGARAWRVVQAAAQRGRARAKGLVRGGCAARWQHGGARRDGRRKPAAGRHVQALSALGGSTSSAEHLTSASLTTRFGFVSSCGTLQVWPTGRLSMN